MRWLKLLFWPGHSTLRYDCLILYEVFDQETAKYMLYMYKYVGGQNDVFIILYMFVIQLHVLFAQWCNDWIFIMNKRACY